MRFKKKFNMKKQEDTFGQVVAEALMTGYATGTTIINPAVRSITFNFDSTRFTITKKKSGKFKLKMRKIKNA